jgi:glycosyltransferase involved in cell wall biosynthesis
VHDPRTADLRPKIHLINPMFSAAGGSELRTVGLFHELSPHADVTIWSTEPADPALSVSVPIRLINRDEHPVGGTIVIIGVWYGVGEWIRRADPRRIVLVYNTDQPYDFAVTYRRLNQFGFYNVEVVFASQVLKDTIEGMDGEVHPSPIDTRRFSPVEREPGRPFTVGRLSRDVPEKHHPEDPALYRRLTGEGFRVRLMGASCLAPSLVGVSGVEVVPALGEDAADFLRSLDCFYYRTHEAWVEAWGRVVAEAMACGLPVVAHASGGYRDIVEQGVNGFLFETKDEAERHIRHLAADRELRARIGQAARQTIERLYGPAEHQKVLEFYLRT